MVYHACRHPKFGRKIAGTGMVFGESAGGLGTVPQLVRGSGGEAENLSLHKWIIFVFPEMYCVNATSGFYVCSSS